MIDLRRFSWSMHLALFPRRGAGEKYHKSDGAAHVTQPMLSCQLMQLEDELGVKLFRHSQYGVVLTDDGILLRRRTQEIVELADKAEREL